MSDVTSVREITIEGERFECRCFDPHGFWKVKYASGKGAAQPKEIDGQFTSLTEVEKALHAIVSKKTKKDPKDFKIDVVNPLADKD